MVKISKDTIKKKLWLILVRITKRYWFYPYLYRSYWHSLFCRNHKGCLDDVYYTAMPNSGAGIGHQMANWIAGYWWARQFGLKFAHTPFSSEDWDRFLGFGVGEPSVNELKKQGFLLRKLPLFVEDYEKEIEVQKKIISSYAGQKVVLMAEQDQNYRDQFGVMKDIQKKFYAAPSRKNDDHIYDKCHFNIAIHVRRGDIMTNLDSSVFKMRYISNDYFYNVLYQVLEKYKSEKEPHIYFFSQGSPDDFPEFKEFRNLHWCFNMSAQLSFLHMVYADLLITSKSSFSYKPALLSAGIKVCPKEFWHGYPEEDPKWILSDNNGYFDTAKLEKLFN